jgi:DNA-directed RNA polymerase sigma subunit (sigma70/sigma32)
MKTLEEKERYWAILEAITTLTTEETDLIWRHFFLDQSVREISRAYGLTRDGKRAKIEKALRKLRHSYRVNMLIPHLPFALSWKSKHLYCPKVDNAP